VLADLSVTCPHTQVEVRHASTAAQLAALRHGDLDVALARERPADPDYDAVLVVEEAMGVILAASRADELASPAGVRLHELARLHWIGFPQLRHPDLA
jgi:DNA-binding transcriptional LysR family regulator